MSIPAPFYHIMNRGDWRHKLFGHLFNGRDKSLVVDAASAGCLRRMRACGRRGGGETDRVNMFD